MGRLGVFHPDSNLNRTNAQSRLALLKAMDLPKCDLLVLNQMMVG